MCCPHKLEQFTFSGDSFLFRDLRIQQIEDRLVGAPEIRALAEKLGDPGAVKIAPDVLAHAAAGHGLALREQTFAQLEHCLRAGHVYAGCGDGSIELLSVQMPGKKRMDADQWFRGLRAGENGRRPILL